MKIKIVNAISLLEEVGFYYDKIEDCFISQEYDAKLYLHLRDCTDLVKIINKIRDFEKEMAQHFAKEGVKAEIKDWLEK